MEPNKQFSNYDFMTCDLVTMVISREETNKMASATNLFTASSSRLKGKITKGYHFERVQNIIDARKQTKLKAVELSSCDRETDGENRVLNVSNGLGHVQSAGTPHILPRTDLDSFRPIEGRRMTDRPIVFFLKGYGLPFL